jgi:hypothetical protein
MRIDDNNKERRSNDSDRSDIICKLQSLEVSIEEIQQSLNKIGRQCDMICRGKFKGKESEGGENHRVFKITVVLLLILLVFL